MSFDYIRERYKVPAKRGARVTYEGRPGTVTGFRGAYIKVRLDGEQRESVYHPTWHIKYEAKDDAE